MNVLRLYKQSGYKCIGKFELYAEFSHIKYNKERNNQIYVLNLKIEILQSLISKYYNENNQ